MTVVQNDLPIYTFNRTEGDSSGLMDEQPTHKKVVHAHKDVSK